MYLDSCYSIIFVYLINLFIHLGTHLVLACIAICVSMQFAKLLKKKKKRGGAGSRECEKILFGLERFCTLCCSNPIADLTKLGDNISAQQML